MNESNYSFDVNWRISIWCMAVPVEMDGSPDNAATCADFLGI